MSEDPKPYIGIRLSRTPESPKSLQAQEEALRAAADELADFDPNWRTT